LFVINSELAFEPGYIVLDKYILGDENSCPVNILSGNNILPMCLSKLLFSNDSEELIPDPIEILLKKFTVELPNVSVDPIALGDRLVTELIDGDVKASLLAIDDVNSKYVLELNTFNCKSVGILSEDIIALG
jgi:hypothetical protein